MQIYLTRAMHYFETVRYRNLLSGEILAGSGFDFINVTIMNDLNHSLSDLLCSLNQMRMKKEVEPFGGLDTATLVTIGNIRIRHINRYYYTLHVLRAYYIINRMERVIKRIVHDTELIKERFRL